MEEAIKTNFAPEGSQLIDQNRFSGRFSPKSVSIEEVNIGHCGISVVCLVKDDHCRYNPVRLVYRSHKDDYSCWIDVWGVDGWRQMFDCSAVHQCVESHLASKDAHLCSASACFNALLELYDSLSD